MTLTPQSQAIMLLTASFGRADTADQKPLTNKEWSRFAEWLKHKELAPSALITQDPGAVLADWSDKTVTVSRLQSLLGRGAAFGLALEKWERAGIWVITRSDPEYPKRLKHHLRGDSPPIFFGVGRKALLNDGGVAIVGSRDASENDLAFTANLGAAAAQQGYSVVSGGARGVDQTAMLAAIESGGTAVGVLADKLMSATSSSLYRKSIMSGDLVLLSPFNPDAGFHVGNAMARNRYIYCLSDAAVVISSTPDKGGTWSGALEDLRGRWVPLWVKQTSAADSGNPELVRRGANWLPGGIENLSELFSFESAETSVTDLDDLVLLAKEQIETADGRISVSSADDKKSMQATDTPPEAPLEADAYTDFYVLFVARMSDLTVDVPLSAEEISERLELHKTQVTAWLKRAVDDKFVVKLSKPVRYQARPAPKSQPSLFGDNT